MLQDVMARMDAKRAERQARIDAQRQAIADAEQTQLERTQELEDTANERRYELYKMNYEQALREGDPQKIAETKRALAQARKYEADIPTEEEELADLENTRALAAYRRSLADSQEVSDRFTAARADQLEKQIRDGNPGMTPYQAANLAMKQAERESDLMDFIVNPKQPIEARRVEAQKHNTGNMDSPVYYRYAGKQGAPFFRTEVMEPIYLPRDPETGKQMTLADLYASADAAGMSPEDLLRRWRLIQ